MIGAWIGRARGIIAIGVVLTIALAIAAAVDVPLRGGIGNRFVNPTQVGELPTAYHLGIGQQTIDLGGLAVGNRKASVTANVGIGRLEVDVPDNTKIVVRARAGTGDVRLFGDESGGTQVDRRVIWSPPAGTAAAANSTSICGPASAASTSSLVAAQRRGVNRTDRNSSQPSSPLHRRRPAATFPSEQEEFAMKRHDTDWTSLIAGLTFCVIAVAYLGGEITGRSLELRWVVPLLLIGLGAAGVAGTRGSCA